MTDRNDKQDSGKLYVSDAELCRRLGVGERTARVAIRELERNRGFPRKDPLFGERRYWPAVKAFLDRRSGISIVAPLPPDGQENYGNEPTTDRQGTRPRMAKAR